MTDHFEDWEKKYWAQKQKQLQNKQNNPSNPNAYTRMPPSNPEELPHFDPASIQQQAPGPQGNPDPSGWKDVDPMTSMYMNQDALAARGMGPQNQCVMVREGATHYRAVDAQNFGTTMPLVKNCGPIGDVNGKEFEMRGLSNCYIIDNMNVVDMGNVDPSKTIQLVEVKAPFVGAILVDKRDVINIQGQTPGPQVLND